MGYRNILMPPLTCFDPSGNPCNHPPPHIRPATSSIRFENPHSLSYQPNTRHMPAAVTRVSGQAITILSARARMSVETSARSVAPITVPEVWAALRNTSFTASKLARRQQLRRLIKVRRIDPEEMATLLASEPDLLTVLSGRERTVRLLDEIRDDVGDAPDAWLPRLLEVA